MMYLALTYDHRLLDGKDAVLFLKKIQTHVQDPRRMLFDIWSYLYNILSDELLFLNYLRGLTFQ